MGGTVAEINEFVGAAFRAWKEGKGGGLQ
jgi:hypothetical protein